MHQPGRPRRRRPVRSAGAAGDAFGSKVMLTRVSTSAAAAGRGLDELAHDLPGGQRGGRVEGGGDRVGQGGAGLGCGVDGDRHPPHRGQVAEAGQPAAPVGDPGVGVCPVGQPGGGGDHPQRGGHQAGAAVQHDAVPAAVAVLGVQQRQRGQDAGHPERGGMLGDDRGPVAGVVARRAVPPAQPPQRGQRQRLAAGPGQAQPAGEEHRRATYSRAAARRRHDDQRQQGAEHGERPAAPSPNRPMPRRRRQPP